MSDNREPLTDEYKDALRKLAEGKDPKDGWRPVIIDGLAVAWVQVSLDLSTERGLHEAAAYLACCFGNKRGEG